MSALCLRAQLTARGHRLAATGARLPRTLAGPSDESEGDALARLEGGHRATCDKALRAVAPGANGGPAPTSSSARGITGVALSARNQAKGVSEEQGSRCDFDRAFCGRRRRPIVPLVFLASTTVVFLSVVLSFLSLLRQRPYHGANGAGRPLFGDARVLWVSPPRRWPAEPCPYRDSRGRVDRGFKEASLFASPRR